MKKEYNYSFTKKFKMAKKRTCVFISGKGSNLKNLIDHSFKKNSKWYQFGIY